MKYQEPETLNSRTPKWFKEWHDHAFWHFKYEVEAKLAFHNKILWAILGTILIATITNLFM